jgi:cytidyltransferase-like protein
MTIINKEKTVQKIDIFCKRFQQMKTTAIIAEFNPFHNGHKYLIDKAKEQLGADHIIIIMSGDFTQRGIPALTDKFSRAQMALSCGADLVLELPSSYSLSSAEYFASGAVSILTRLGIVDSLFFGSECGDTEILTQIATILNNESEDFALNISRQLKSGDSYALARQKALFTELQDRYSASYLEEVLSSPNNILGIEYIRAIQNLGSSIKPYTIARNDNGYHQNSLPITKNHIDYIITDETSDSLISLNNIKITSTNFTSANAIRNEIINSPNAFADSTLTATISQFVPNEVMSVLKKYQESKKSFVNIDMFSEYLKYKLNLEYNNGYTEYADVTEDISNKIKNNLHGFTTISEFTAILKSKDIAYSRISRCLMHILLNMKQEDLDLYKANKYPGYARILGLKKEASHLLKEAKKNSTDDFVIIDKLAKATQNMDSLSLSYRILQQDIQASAIYDLLSGEKRTEYQKEIIIQ